MTRLLSRLSFFLTLFAISLAVTPSQAQPTESGLGPIAGIKCVIDSVRSCDTRYPAAYRGGWVFLSSESARNQFLDALQSLHSQPDRFLALQTRANHQLTLTGQAVQVACPVTGLNTTPEQALAVGGVPIQVHDADAKERLQQMPSLLERARYVFAPNAFHQTFTVPKQVDPSSPSQWIDFQQQLQSRILARQPFGTRCQR